MTYDIGSLKAAHKHSGPNRCEIEASQICGCFYCCYVFPPSEIDMWVNDEMYATCPKCSIDSVLGDKSGYPVTDSAFLKAMSKEWFS